MRQKLKQAQVGSYSTLGYSLISYRIIYDGLPELYPFVTLEPGLFEGIVMYQR